MFKLAFNPRNLREDFPANVENSEQLKFLLNCAVLDPLSHSTPPWNFKVVNDAIELYADKTDALPIADLDYRELIISCGTALFNLRIAIRHFGYRDVVDLLPEQNNRNLLARISLGSKRIAQLEENLLFRAIFKRCTSNQDFDDCLLPSSLVSELESATCSEGSWLQIMTKVIPKTDYEAVINLIADGDRLNQAEHSWHHKLAQWIQLDHDYSLDGIPPQTREMNQNLDVIAPLISRTNPSFTFAQSQSTDCPLLSPASVLMLISSKDDNPQAWIETGEALAHLLYRAKLDNVWAAFLNQPIQIPHLRSRLQRLFPEHGYPQIMLRLGYAKQEDG